MLDGITGFLDRYSDPLAAAAIIIAALGWLRSILIRNRLDDAQQKLDQRAEELRLENIRLDERLDHVDPERIIDKAAELYEAGKFDKVEQIALDFTNRQTEAFGKAAEYLAEQRLMDSETDGVEAAEEAARFAAVGQAAVLDSKRLSELAILAARRAEGARKGEPIEALSMDGMTKVELNRLSQA